MIKSLLGMVILTGSIVLGGAAYAADSDANSAYQNTPAQTVSKPSSHTNTDQKLNKYHKKTRNAPDVGCISCGQASSSSSVPWGR